MRLDELFENPLAYIDVSKIIELINEEADIAAAESDSPNSPDYERIRSKIWQEYASKFYTKIATDLLEAEPIVKEFGPKLRIRAAYKVEMLIDGRWFAEAVKDSLAEATDKAHQFRRELIESESKGESHGNHS